MKNLIAALTVLIAFSSLTSTPSFAQPRQVMLEAKLIASDASNGALFGNSVAISGDTAVIGAYWNHIETKRWQGSVYFGSGVGISNDTIVVGADSHDFKIPNSNRGTAYIFSSVRSEAGSLGQRSFAHSVGPSRTRRITLIRNAGKNGYTTTRQGDLIYFQAANVADPSSGKLLAGLKQLEYQCPGNPASITVDLQFSNGHSDKISVSCLALIKPRIILQEEHSEPN